MDLYAYTQIEMLENIMKENGIEVPRLRGLRLMSQEKPEHDYIPEDLEYEILQNWVATNFGRDKYMYTYSSWTSYVVEQLSYSAFKNDEVGNVRKINWKLLRRKEKKRNI